MYREASMGGDNALGSTTFRLQPEGNKLKAWIPERVVIGFEPRSLLQ
jgi:hypothetical protein